jgi:hypothetical protein
MSDATPLGLYTIQWWNVLHMITILIYNVFIYMWTLSLIENNVLKVERVKKN